MTFKAKMTTLYTNNPKTDLNIDINLFFQLCISSPQLFVDMTFDPRGQTLPLRQIYRFQMHITPGPF